MNQQLSKIRTTLNSRSKAIARAWHEVISPICYVPYSDDEIKGHLSQLTDQAITLLSAQSFSAEEAEEIGLALTALHFLQPEVIGLTQEVLARELLQGFSPADIMFFRTRMAAFLGGLAAGFFRGAREIILSEQEEVRLAQVAALRRLEQEVRQSEERYRTLVESAKQAIYMVDRQGIFRFVNGSAARQLGGQVKDFIGKSMWDLFPKAIADTQMSDIRDTLDQGVLKVFESKTMLQGRKYWSETTLQPINYDNMTVALGVSTDITERKRSEAALRRYSERLRILHEIDQGILAAASPQAIAEVMLEHVPTLIPSSGAAVVLFDFEAEDYLVHAGEIGKYTAGKRYPITDWETVKRLKRGTPVVLNDVRDLQHQSPVWSYVESLGGNSVLSAPMMAAGELIGLFVLVADELYAYDEQHAKVAGEIATTLAIAIQNARLLEAERAAQEENKRLLAEVRHYAHDLQRLVEERTQRLSALYNVTSIANRFLDLQTILDRSLETATGTMTCAGGLILLRDNRSGRFKLVAHNGITESYANHLSTLMTSNGLPVQILVEGKPLVVDDWVEIAGQLAGIDGERTHGLAAVPMRAGGNGHGVLCLLTDSGRLLPSDEVDLLSSIANHVGGAVENARLRHKAEQLAVIEERERLARELHDSVTQALYSLTLFAEAARDRMFDRNEALVHQYLEDISATAHQALKEMRLMLYELRTPSLQQQGLVETLRYRLDAVEGRSNLKTRLLTETLQKLPPAVEEGLYRIAQEALNNTLKHADASEVTLHIRTEDGKVFLEIDDNGKGFDLEAAQRLGGMGLQIMHERAEGLGGRLTISSVLGEGTTILVEAELREPATVIDDLLSADE